MKKIGIKKGKKNATYVKEGFVMIKTRKEI